MTQTREPCLSALESQLVVVLTNIMSFGFPPGPFTDPAPAGPSDLDPNKLWLFGTNKPPLKG